MELFPDGDLTVPANFERTAPAHRDGDARGALPESYALNPQTAAFCQRLGIQDLNRILYERNAHRIPQPQPHDQCH